MNRQQPLALAPPAGDADWSERSLLDGATRRALVSINLAFLDLAGELAEEGRLKQIPGLPPRAIDSLIGLEAGPRLCERLPFALFDLRFGDGGFWSAEVAAAGGVQDAASLAGGGRAHRRLHARGDHGRLASRADARVGRAARVRRVARDHRGDRGDAGRRRRAPRAARSRPR